MKINNDLSSFGRIRTVKWTGVPTVGALSGDGFLGDLNELGSEC